MKKLSIVCLGVLFTCNAVAQGVILPSVLSSNAVLKQNSKVPLRGWAMPGEKVAIVCSWNEKDTIRTVTKNTGKFEAIVETPRGSRQSHSISFNGKELMQNVLIGEVWICGGQSNMQWSINHGIKDGAIHAQNANDPFVRLFNVPLRSAETPQENFTASWTECNPQTVKSTSAIGYFFAKYLESTLKVPVGIIVNAWSGAAAESFVQSELIESDSVLFNNLILRNNIWNDDRHGKAYNAMVAPILSFPVSGVLWYQGESNVPTWNVYERMMTKLISGWRKGFGEEVPFYMAQIAPYNYTGNKSLNAANLRQAQEMVARKIDNCEMIVVSDLVDDVNNIHPIDKVNPGKRFANIALSHVYGIEGLPHCYPMFESVELKGKKAIVTVGNLVGQLQVGKEGKDKTIIGLVVVDSKGETHNATGKIVGVNQVEVSADKVKDIVEVRYCFDDTTIGNLFSGEGLPLAPFSSNR